MKKQIIIVVSSILLLLSLGISYAYFTGMITGEGKKISVISKELRIVFKDDQTLSNTDIIPGWRESKTFSVENQSDNTFNYNIVLEGLVNTFVTEGFLQYKITSANGYNMEGYLDIPKSDTPKDIVLAYDIDIEPSVTQEYAIEFVYHNSDTVDQSEDMGKVFEGTLAITEGSVDPNIKYTVTMNVENNVGIVKPTSDETIKNESLEFSVTPSTGYDISTMSVSCNPVANTNITDNKIKVSSIKENHDCTVSFDKEIYEVLIKVNNGVSDAYNKRVPYGEGASATITPNYGYTLSGATVSGDGCTLEEGTLTISNVQVDGTCEVTLPREKYTVTLTGEGLNTSDAPKTVEYEGETSINYTLKDGYLMSETSVNCDNSAVPSVSGNTITVSYVTANTTCTITPILQSYDVTLVVNGGTGGSTKNVSHGSNTTFDISASTGYKLELDGNITCTGSASGTLSEGTVTISNVTTVQTCTVNLKKQTYSVTIGVNDITMGSVSPGSTTVNHGGNLEVTITPNNGYVYSSNTCGLTPVNGKLKFTNITSTINCSVTFVEDKTLAAVIKKAYPSQGVRASFSEIYTASEMHEAEDVDGNITYYLTGNPNNWVSFAGSLWRIIRVNGDGSVRMLYAGSGGEDGYIGSAQVYGNSVYSNNPAYVGWKYDLRGTNGRGTSTTSYAYQTVKQEFYDKLIYADKNYINTNAIYCADRTASTSEAANASTTTFTAGTNWPDGIYYFGAYRRLVNKSTPSLQCEIDDRFTDGFGLMTADEIVLTGGLYGANNPNVYYSLNKSGGSPTGGYSWWTMSPCYWDSEFGAFVWAPRGSAYPGRLDTSYEAVLRPVISLKKEVLVIGGDGTGSNPYTVTMP